MRICGQARWQHSEISVTMSFGYATMRPGIDDVQVLALARTERRLLITQDKGFGDLVFARGLPASYGVILLRARRTQTDRTRELVDAVEGRDNWFGIFAVAEGGRTRATELP